ncbi:Phage terminase small subunit [Sporomusa ovata]|uniref:Phage terminase small subunit n=1 Tax=Sporomusa ovata TaxID=2378 RepID=A0A0U1L2C0_9FIRM|nr:Phage terminase small subunit [Sporomusa ovata]
MTASFFVAQNEEVISIAIKGRKPKPTALKILEGNAGKRQLNNELTPTKKAPEMP